MAPEASADLSDVPPTPTVPLDTSPIFAENGGGWEGVGVSAPFARGNLHLVISYHKINLRYKTQPLVLRYSIVTWRRFYSRRGRKSRRKWGSCVFGQLWIRLVNFIGRRLS